MIPVVVSHFLSAWRVEKNEAIVPIKISRVFYCEFPTGISPRQKRNYAAPQARFFSDLGSSFAIFLLKNRNVEWVEILRYPS